MPEQDFRIVCVEIKNNHGSPGLGGGELALAGESVTELFKLSLYEFVSRVTVNRL